MKTLWLLLLFCGTTARAQVVDVKPQAHKVKGGNAEGYSSVVEGKAEAIEPAWSKFVKGLGKTKVFSDLSTITDPILNGNEYKGMTLFTDFVTKNNVTRVWLGWKPVDWLESQREAVDKELSKQVYQFTLKFYQDQVLAQIDESEQAVRAVERAQQKSVNEGGDLQMRLEETSRERVQLERALETNKFNNTILLQKLENNKKSLDSLSVALDKVKKAVELQRQKLREIH
jgi:hypothetical protein